jgi:hypothetical protein
MYLELRNGPVSREHARPQSPAGSRRYGGGAEEPAPAPVGVTSHRTQRPGGQVGPPGPHPAQPSSSLNPGGERRPIPPPLAPLIAQLVRHGLVFILPLSEPWPVYLGSAGFGVVYWPCALCVIPPTPVSRRCSSAVRYSAANEPGAGIYRAAGCERPQGAVGFLDARCSSCLSCLVFGV